MQLVNLLLLIAVILLILSVVGGIALSPWLWALVVAAVIVGAWAVVQRGR